MTDPDARRQGARFAGSSTDEAADGRLSHPSTFRNSAPLAVALSAMLGDAPGRLLEIGSGTGQHAAMLPFAFSDIEWWPSDPDPDHRRSIAAWQAYTKVPERPAFDIDATSDWAARDDISALSPFGAVLSCNVIHIAPFAVAEGIVGGAAQVLRPGGRLVFYGPFHIGGKPTGSGNERFDQSLRAQDPAWGIRDVDQVGRIARAAGFGDPEVRMMPSDNRLVIFTKA